MAFKFLNCDIFSSQSHLKRGSKYTFRTAYVNARELLKRGLWGSRSVSPAQGTPLHTEPEVHPASYPLGKGGFTPGLQRPLNDAHYSPPHRAEIKFRGARLPSLPYVSYPTTKILPSPYTLFIIADI